MRNTLLVLVMLYIGGVFGQSQNTPQPQGWKNTYRGTERKINDLVDTKLEVKFDFSKAYLYGKAWVTLTPHFYSTDSVQLDAKGMNINKVSLFKNGIYKNLSYTYDSLLLQIKLDKVYTKNERYVLFIDYVSKPNELRLKGSEAITDAKGLYFINPLGKESNKPVEIWTQGETEGSSVWFPTIDDPNQKTTQEICMTVPAKFVTLSNGKLTSQKINANGTRTDTWKMDLPHSPYLFFMGVGDFAIVKDKYKGKEVNYYVEKEYEKVARRIFGLTPEMIAFFSKKLDYEYPWVKYAQMTGRDYVSGAMENTTATLHSDYLQQNARQLSDGNQYEDYISHELFHQWFGNLVTAESWSNLTVNESFANYSEVLWREYKYGKDDAMAHGYKDMLSYILRGDPSADLVRFYYQDKEDMFDLVTYQKGGRILNMLRHHIGDDAFFKSLNLYLKTHQFKNAEAHQLRLAFEQVTGQDLNWFFNQWYFSKGHPVLDISYDYDSSSHKAFVYLKQLQPGKTFKLPMAIDVYNSDTTVRYKIFTNARLDTLVFPSPEKPLLINVDADKILLTEKTDHKTLTEYIFQYKHAKNYVDRREALDYAIDSVRLPGALQFITTFIDDPFYELKERSLSALEEQAGDLMPTIISGIEVIAKNSRRRTTRAAAIDVLAKRKDPKYRSLFLSGTSDSSYTVAGASLEALAKLDEKTALSLLPVLKKDAKGRLEEAIKLLDVLTKSDADFDELTAKFDSVSNFDKLAEYHWYLTFLSRVNNTENFKSGLDRIISFRKLVGGFDQKYADKINNQLRELAVRKQAVRTPQNTSEINAQIKYLQEKINEEE